MDWPGWVGAQILDLPVCALAQVDVAKACACLDRVVHLLLQPRVSQVNVDEARPSDLDTSDRPIRWHVVSDELGDGAWVAGVTGLAQRRRRDHGDVGAVVAVVGLLGA